MQYLVAGPVHKDRNSTTGHGNTKGKRAVAAFGCCSVSCACTSRHQRLLASLPVEGFIVSLRSHTPAYAKVHSSRFVTNRITTSPSKDKFREEKILGEASHTKKKKKRMQDILSCRLLEAGIVP